MKDNEPNDDDFKDRDYSEPAVTKTEEEEYSDSIEDTYAFLNRERFRG